MYSIVMLMAMSGAPEMPAWGGRTGGCCGCNPAYIRALARGLEAAGERG